MENNIFSSSYPDIELPSGNFISYLSKDWHKWEDLTALVCGYTERELTYKELRQQVEKWCGYFSAKYPKQTIIGMITPNTVEAAVCIMGMMAAGMIFNGLCEETRVDDIVDRLQSLNIRDVIIHKSHQGKMEEAMKKIGDKFTKIFLGCDNSPMENEVTFSDVLIDETVRPRKPVEIEGSEIIYIIYSSGTTGKPKPVTLPHRTLAYNLAVISQPQWSNLPITSGTCQAVGYAHRDFYHSFGLFTIFFCSNHLGHKMIIKKFEEDKIIDELHKWKISKVYGVPSLLRILAKIPSQRPSIKNHLKCVVTAGAPLPDSFSNEFRKNMPEVFLQNLLGMSEATVVAMRPASDRKPGSSIAILNNVKVKICDMTSGENLPINCKGEIMCKVPWIFTEYLFNPEATAEAKTADGWYCSGDVGMVDENNYLHLCDRIKQIIKPGLHLPVYSAEVEDVLLSQPGVIAACVVGVPHEENVEAPRAFVVLEDSSVTKEILHQLIADKLPKNNELVGGIVFLDALPFLPSGKVDRLKLKKFEMQ